MKYKGDYSSGRSYDQGDVTVYTDGVAEATNAQNELFGMSRTVDALNRAADKSPEEILQAVNSAVEAFVGDAEQFDDLTMMCIEFRGKDL